MSIFNKFNKKKGSAVAPEELTAAVSGRVIDISAVKDDVFSQKMMGDGIAIIPDSLEIVAPSSGSITSVYPTGHAVNMHLDIGINIIIHIGIDTVELKGEGFALRVKEGQKVSRGDTLVKINKKLLLNSTVDMTTLVIFPELKERNIEKNSVDNVTAGKDVVATIVK